MELHQRRALVDAVMAQHVGAEDRAERGIGKGQGVDRSGADRAPALCRGASAGEGVGVEPDRCPCRVLGRDPRQEPAGAAAGIEQRLRRRRAGRPAIQQQQVRVQRREPPHPVLGPVELVVFGAVQVASPVLAPHPVPLPARGEREPG